MLYIKQNLPHHLFSMWNMSLIWGPMPEKRGVSKCPWTFGHPVGVGTAREFETILGTILGTVFGTVLNPAPWSWARQFVFYLAQMVLCCLTDDCQTGRRSVRTCGSVPLARRVTQRRSPAWWRRPLICGTFESCWKFAHCIKYLIFFALYFHKYVFV